MEVWDVVDRAKNTSATHNKDTGIKLEHTSKKQEKSGVAGPVKTAELGDLGLDAGTVNVYRNCHAVIFMFDVTKPWTFEYVVKEAFAVPANVAILVLVSWDAGQ